MGTRQRAGDLGAVDARRQVEAVGRDIRSARLALGMSIAAAGRRGGMSPHSTVGSSAATSAVPPTTRSAGPPVPSAWRAC